MKQKVRWYTSVMLGLLAVVLGSQPAVSADKKDTSLADVKVVLQISDNDPDKQTLVLNVANNLIKHYGPDTVAIEVVAFGPGLRLLFAENSNKQRIAGLVSNNVKFSACGNTISAMSKQLGHEPAINSSAVRVDAGIVRIMELVKQGYVLVKP